MEVPASLSIGTQVSAKYKGAFCEAKVKSVVKQVKCRVTFGLGHGSATLSDEFIKHEGNLGVGSVVEARHPEKHEYLQATVNKIQDQSQYTVVFDDGDITTLRRNALCMKSGKHYNASESLDNLPLTHPEHFSTPVSGSRRRKRGGHKESENEESSSSENEEGVSSCYLTNIGRVVWTENTENKKSKVKETWFPALIVAPSASDTVKINTKEEFLIRSFKDGRYYTVRKKDTNQFKKDSPKKSDNPLIKEAMDKAISYIETKELPPHWDKEHLFNMGGAEESSTESSESEEIEDDEDEESREEKDHLVAELYKHMEDRGAPINRTPNIVGKDLDLYKLFRIVYKYGGHQRVTNNNKWRQIAHKLGFETTWCVNQVRVNYKRYLQSFEELYKTLGCTMKSGSTSKQRQGSGNGSSGRVQIRGRSREMLKQQLSSSKDSSNSSHNEDTASDFSKEALSISSTKFIVNTVNENSIVEKVVVSAKKPLSEESSKEDSEEVEEVKLPISVPKKSIKEKKISTSTSKSDLSIKKSKDEAKFVGTRNRRDSNSSSVSGTLQIKTPKDDSTTSGPSAKKSLTKELSEIDVVKKPIKSSSNIKLESSTDEPVKVSTKGRKKHKESKKAVSTISTSVTTTVNPSSGNNSSSTVNSSEDTSDNKSRSSDSAGEEEPQYLSPDVDVRVGDKIKVFYIRGIIYDAKVIKCQEQEKNNSKWPRYYVHYQGWNARYDEWINRSRIAENLSWTKDRPKKDGKEDSSDGSIDKSFKKEKIKVDGRKERKIVKRDSTSRASTPAKSYGDSPAPLNKRSVRGVKKMESDISDAEEDDSEKSSSKKCLTPVRVTTKKNVTPISQKRGRGRKRKEESENEEVEVEKDLNEETVDITSSPTKAKRGRKSTKESQAPTPSSVISTIGSVPKKEEVEEPQSSLVSDESPSKRSINRVTPIREQRPSIRSTSTKIKDSDKKSSIKKEDEAVEKESKFSKNTDEEDPYAFKEPEPFEEVKFETPPRKVSTPPNTNTPTTVAFIPQKNLENDLSSLRPSKDSIKKEVSILMDDSSLNKSNEQGGSTVDQSEVVVESKTVMPVGTTITLSKLEEEEEDVDDSDEEGKLEIVTPKKDNLEDSPNKSISNEDNLIQPHDQLKESIEQPSVIIEIKKSLDKPTDDPGKPVLQLTEKQKELFPFLSAIRTASLGSISSSSVEGSKDEPNSQEIKIEVMTSPSKKPVVTPNTTTTATTTSSSSSTTTTTTTSSTSSSSSTTTTTTTSTTTITNTTVVGNSGSNVKKRKSHRRFNSSELVIESETESDEEDVKPKEQNNIMKDIDSINSTKSVTIKKMIKKDHDADDVDLVCAETIPGSPVHPGISDSNLTEEEEEISTSKSEKVNKVVEVKKLEMPFATVPESGLGPAVPDVPKPPTPSLTIATKKISSKTEKKELETVLVSSTSTKLPSIAQPTASIVKDNINLPTSLINEPPSETPPPPPISSGYKSPTGDSTSDIDSMSGKIKLEVEDSRLDVEGSSSGDAPTNPSTVHSSSRRNVGLKRRAAEKVNEAPRSPAQKRKRRTRDVTNTSTSALSTLSSRYRGATRGRHSSGRGVGIRGNLDDETDESEETKDSTLSSLGSLDDQALVALSQRSPKSSRYNFYVDLDPAMDSSERILLIQQNLEELRKTYLNIKSELALIERRRKKIRRKERERGSNSINSSSSGSNSGSSKNNPAHIEVTA